MFCTIRKPWFEAPQPSAVFMKRHRRVAAVFEAAGRPRDWPSPCNALVTNAPGDAPGVGRGGRHGSLGRGVHDLPAVAGREPGCLQRCRARRRTVERAGRLRRHARLRRQRARRSLARRAAAHDGDGAPDPADRRATRLYAPVRRRQAGRLAGAAPRTARGSQHVVGRLSQRPRGARRFHAARSPLRSVARVHGDHRRVAPRRSAGDPGRRVLPRDAPQPDSRATGGALSDALRLRLLRGRPRRRAPARGDVGRVRGRRGARVRRLLQHALSAQAERRPEAVALVMDAVRMTYAQLEAASNRLARMLRAAGVQRGDRVALLLPKSPRAIVAIVAVLKAEATYVPLDTTSPVPRLAPMLQSTAPRCLLAEAGVAAVAADLLAAAPDRAP